MLSVLIRNEEQYQIVKNYPLDCIYTDNLKLAFKYDLYYETKRAYQKLPKLPAKLLINDTGLLLLPNKKIVTNYSLNVANDQTIALLKKYNVEKITLSVEVTLEELKFLKDKDRVEVIIYGRILDMLLKKHPIIKDSNYKLVYNNHLYPITVDEDEKVSIYHYEPINLIPNIKAYQDLGLKYFRLDFFDESPEKIAKIIDSVIF